MIQGVPRISERSRGFVGGGGRKPLPKMMNGLALSPPDAMTQAPNGTGTSRGSGSGNRHTTTNGTGWRPGRLR